MADSSRAATRRVNSKMVLIFILIFIGQRLGLDYHTRKLLLAGGVGHVVVRDARYDQVGPERRRDGDALREQQRVAELVEWAGGRAGGPPVNRAEHTIWRAHQISTQTAPKQHRHSIDTAQIQYRHSTDTAQTQQHPNSTRAAWAPGTAHHTARTRRG